jgi:hypothetical protein
MIARKCTQSAIVQAAESVGVRADVSGLNQSGTSYRFTLKLGPDKLYQRTSPTQTRADGEPRRIAAVCWHGHAAFFRALFKLCPSAIVSSSRMGQVRFTADNFETTYPKTGYWNIGSQMYPCAFHNACDYDSHPVNRRGAKL